MPTVLPNLLDILGEIKAGTLTDQSRTRLYDFLRGVNDRLNDVEDAAEPEPTPEPTPEPDLVPTAAQFTNHYLPFTNNLIYGNRNQRSSVGAGVWVAEGQQGDTIDWDSVRRLVFSAIPSDGRDRGALFSSPDYLTQARRIRLSANAAPIIGGLDSGMPNPGAVFIVLNSGFVVATSDGRHYVLSGYLKSPPASRTGVISLDPDRVLEAGDVIIAGGQLIQFGNLRTDLAFGTVPVVGRPPAVFDASTPNMTALVDTDTGEVWLADATARCWYLYLALRGDGNEVDIEVTHSDTGPAGDATRGDLHVNGSTGEIWVYESHWLPTLRNIYRYYERQSVGFEIQADSLRYDLQNNSYSLDVVRVPELDEGTLPQPPHNARFDMTLSLPYFSGIQDGASNPPDAGQDGQSIANIIIYRRVADTATTGAPTGGSYDFAGNTFTPPTNWQVSFPADEKGYVILRSEAIAYASGLGIWDGDDNWSEPTIVEEPNTIANIYQRASSRPPVPPITRGADAVPVGWYASLADVPDSTGVVWVSFGSRVQSSSTTPIGIAVLYTWTWDTPFRAEGISGSRIFFGQAAPTLSANPASNGDTYIRANGDYYVFTSGNWSLVTNLQGSNIFTGAVPDIEDVAPFQADSKDGDIFVATGEGAGRWWRLQAGVWVYQGDLSGAVAGLSITTASAVPPNTEGEPGNLVVLPSGILWRKEATEWVNTGIDLTDYGSLVHRDNPISPLADNALPSVPSATAGDVFIAEDGRIYQLEGNNMWNLVIRYITVASVMLDYANQVVEWNTLNYGDDYILLTSKGGELDVVRTATDTENTTTLTSNWTSGGVNVATASITVTIDRSTGNLSLTSSSNEGVNQVGTVTFPKRIVRDYEHVASMLSAHLEVVSVFMQPILGSITLTDIRPTKFVNPPITRGTLNIVFSRGSTSIATHTATTYFRTLNFGGIRSYRDVVLILYSDTEDIEHVSTVSHVRIEPRFNFASDVRITFRHIPSGTLAVANFSDIYNT